MWSELSLFKQQAASIHTKNLTATWLTQYNVLEDEDVVVLLKSYKTDELGIFLEVSEQLATDAQVPYILGDGDWARADKVLFSGYEINERKKMVDTVFDKFKETFGYHPKSVGAWYIDPVTLEYVYKKYGVIAAIDCTDQYATDGYGLWGKPWGVPYYPSRLNTLVPAQSIGNKLPVVKIQWALRDPLWGYGIGVPDSTYSVQPNDYVGHHGLGIEYFKKLFGYYLDARNDYQQATIGLEVGTESLFLDELDKQFIETEKRKTQGAQVVTMAQFARWYQDSYPNVSPTHLISGNNALWYNSNWYRVGLTFENGTIILRDMRLYDETQLEDDSVSADRKEKLYRTLFGPIDTLLYDNGKVLAYGAQNIVIASNSGEMRVSWEGTQAGVLHLAPKQAVVNDQILLNINQKIPLGWYRLFWKQLSLIAARVARFEWPKYYPLPWRYARIGQKVVLGVQIKPNHLFGLSFPPLKVGNFYFPFQNLVRFRTWPHINIPALLFVSNSDLYADWFLQNNKDKNLTVVSRIELISEKLKQLRAVNFHRVFENSLVSIWQKTQ